MKKTKVFLWGLSLLWIGCADVYKGGDPLWVEETIELAGETYPGGQGVKCLNVVYYQPSDVTVVDEWHYRVSGVALHVKDFFEENLLRYRITDTIGMEINENPDYVRVHEIRSSMVSADMTEENIDAMGQEVLDWFAQNPDAKRSDNYFVIMPEYTDGFIGHWCPDGKTGMVFAACDNENMKISFFTSPRARARYLSFLGELLYHTACSFYVPVNMQRKSDGYIDLMGVTLGSRMMEFNYPDYCGSFPSGSSYTAGTPDKIRLSEAAVQQLAALPLIQNAEQPDALVITDEHATLKALPPVDEDPETFAATDTLRLFTSDTVRIELKFRSNKGIRGVVCYNDPWVSVEPEAEDLSYRPDLEMLAGFNMWGDAVSYYKPSTDIGFEKNGDEYTVTFDIPMNDMMACKHTRLGSYYGYGNWGICEFWFRFIGEDYSLWPEFASIKGEDLLEEPDTRTNAMEPVTEGNRYIYKVNSMRVNWVPTYYSNIGKVYGYLDE